MCTAAKGSKTVHNMMMRENEEDKEDEYIDSILIASMPEREAIIQKVIIGETWEVSMEVDSGAGISLIPRH